MKGFIATLIATAVALWVAARFVPGIQIPSADFVKIPQDLISFGIVALVFGVVNGMIGPIVKGLSMPFNLFTMGLFGIVLNMVLFLGAAYASDQIGGSLKVGDFPPDLLTQPTLVAAAIGSLVVGFVSALVRLVVPD
jgi:putative membrane protein